MFRVLLHDTVYIQAYIGNYLSFFVFFVLIIAGFETDDISGAESAGVVAHGAEDHESNVAATIATTETTQINRQLLAHSVHHRDDRQVVLSHAETLAEALAVVVAIGHASRYATRSRVAAGAAAEASSDYDKSAAAGHPEDRAESVASVAVAIPRDRHGEGQRERRVRQASQHHATGDAPVADHTGKLRRLQGGGRVLRSVLSRRSENSQIAKNRAEKVDRENNLAR